MFVSIQMIKNLEISWNWRHKIHELIFFYKNWVFSGENR